LEESPELFEARPILVIPDEGHFMILAFVFFYHKVWRRPESSDYKMFWTPAFAGVTILGLLMRSSYLRRIVLSLSGKAKDIVRSLAVFQGRRQGRW
jgi:hypothetical protein